jgi:hypothetical protein
MSAFWFGFGINAGLFTVGILAWVNLRAARAARRRRKVEAIAVPLGAR